VPVKRSITLVKFVSETLIDSDTWQWQYSHYCTCLGHLGLQNTDKDHFYLCCVAQASKEGNIASQYCRYYHRSYCTKFCQCKSAYAMSILLPIVNCKNRIFSIKITSMTNLKLACTFKHKFCSGFYIALSYLSAWLWLWKCITIRFKTLLHFQSPRKVYIDYTNALCKCTSKLIHRHKSYNLLAYRHGQNSDNGTKHGPSFNYISGRVQAPQLYFSETEQPNLKLKTQSKQLLCSLSLGITLPDKRLKLKLKAH
jgi:hypothetical protein